MTDKLNCPKCGVHIDDHEAGRCLDEWVITSLPLTISQATIGVPKPICSHASHYDTIWDNTGFWYCQPPVYENDDAFEWQPIAVSEDIAAAWQVVKKLQRICRIDIENYKWVTKASNTVVRVYAVDFPSFRTEAPTAPLAICRAAIKAMYDGN